MWSPRVRSPGFFGSYSGSLLISSLSLTKCSWGLIRQMRAGVEVGLRFFNWSPNNKSWSKWFPLSGRRWESKPPLSFIAFSISLKIHCEKWTRSIELGWFFLFFGGISFRATCSHIRFHTSKFSVLTPFISSKERSPFWVSASWQSRQWFSRNGFT